MQIPKLTIQIFRLSGCGVVPRSLHFKHNLVQSHNITIVKTMLSNLFAQNHIESRSH